MRLSASVVILVASAALGCAKVAVFPDAVPLSKRQDLSPGSPLYDCHADCGGVIVDARTDGYCDNSTYNDDLSGCLDCALTYDIWQYYGTDVAKAAEACNDSATPSGSSAVSSAVSTAASSANATAGSTAASTTGISASSSAVVSNGSSTATVASSAVNSDSGSTSTASGASASATGSTSDGSAAAALQKETSVLLGAVIIFGTCALAPALLLA